MVAGVPVAAPEMAIVTSWPMILGDGQRAPLIEANRRRLLRAETLRRLAESMFWIGGRRELLELCGLILSGCESELELWGHLHVFDTEGLRHAARQRTVRVGSRTIRMDLAYEAEKVNIEMDGRRYHSGLDQWERDIERDMLVATIGWPTVRFSHGRLHGDIPGCQQASLDILESRRRHVG
jgi:very-short-patch-repair endonuclease